MQAKKRPLNPMKTNPRPRIQWEQQSYIPDRKPLYYHPVEDEDRPIQSKFIAKVNPEPIYEEVTPQTLD